MISVLVSPKLPRPFAGLAMSTPAVLDFDQLLAPISEESPTGPALRDDPALSILFSNIKTARETARDVENRRLRAAIVQSEGGELDQDLQDVGRPDWSAVREQALDILGTKSKDLWVTAWLIEALARLQNFAGLRDGFRLTRELCETYFAIIHPRPDDEEVDWTVSQLTGLNGEDGNGSLIPAIDNIPIVAETRSHRAMTSLDYKEALNLDKLDADTRALRIENGAVTEDDFHKAIAEGNIEFYENLSKDLSEARAEFEQLASTLDELCGKDEDGYDLSPPTSHISRALSDTSDLVKKLTQHLFPQDDDDATDTAAEAGLMVAGSDGGNASVSSREEAFRALLRVADFFRRTEPHSPVSYSLEQAVRWGRMSFPQLMQELIQDDDARREMFRRAGISPTEGAETDAEG